MAELQKVIAGRAAQLVRDCRQHELQEVKSLTHSLQS